MLERQFEDEQDPSEENASTEKQEPEYAFEGYTVEFSEKIMLTLPTAVRDAQEKGQAAA